MNTDKSFVVKMIVSIVIGGGILVGFWLLIATVYKDHQATQINTRDIQTIANFLNQKAPEAAPQK